MNNLKYIRKNEVVQTNVNRYKDRGMNDISERILRKIRYIEQFPPKDMSARMIASRLIAMTDDLFLSEASGYKPGRPLDPFISERLRPNNLAPIQA